MFLKDKGHINPYFTGETLDKLYRKEVYETILSELLPHFEERERYLELSHYATGAYRSLLQHFSSGAFVSDDPFESLYEYHISSSEQKELDIYQNSFTFNRLLPGQSECYDAVFSFLGLSFDNLYALLERALILLKVGGILAIEYPAYWYSGEELSTQEKEIMRYSKENEKKWLFVDPLEPLIEEYKGELLFKKNMEHSHSFNRFELSYLSSLDKLNKAERESNRGHLEICDIPERGLKLRSALLVIKKQGKILTKDSLFNI